MHNICRCKTDGAQMAQIIDLIKGAIVKVTMLTDIYYGWYPAKRKVNLIDMIE